MPLNQREQKRMILHVRARTFEDAARELRSATRTGFDLEDAEKIAATWDARARQLREDADDTFVSSVDRLTVDEMLKSYATTVPA